MTFAKKDTVGGGVWREEIKVPEAALKKLESKGNVFLNPDHRKEIISALDRYSTEKMIHAVSPDVKDVIGRAEHILEISREMERFFKPQLNKSRIDKALISRIKTVRPHWNIECDLADSQFIFLNHRLETVIKNLSALPLNKDGPEGDDIFNALIFDLLKIHRSASIQSQKPTKVGTGQAMFVKAALDILPETQRPLIQSDEALKQRIKRISAKLKSLSEQGT